MRELLSRLGSDEFTEWVAYYQLEPFGDYRGDYRSGVVASTLANVHRGKDARAFTPEDFMPFLERTGEATSVQEDPLSDSVSETDRNVARFKALFAHKVRKGSDGSGGAHATPS